MRAMNESKGGILKRTGSREAESWYFRDEQLGQKFTFKNWFALTALLQLVASSLTHSSRISISGYF